MSALKKAVRDLLEFIESHDVNDEYFCEGDGQMDAWQTPEFSAKIAACEKALKGS